MKWSFLILALRNELVMPLSDLAFLSHRYYPYHYAPYMSDLKGFRRFDLKYEKGEPFLPFQQLLGVLPAASKDLLPEPYQVLGETRYLIWGIVHIGEIDFSGSSSLYSGTWSYLVNIFCPFCFKELIFCFQHPCNSARNSEKADFKLYCQIFLAISILWNITL